jgi:hypothetical protein
MICYATHVHLRRQAQKVELFKNRQALNNALHAKYATSTGDTVVADNEVIFIIPSRQP